MEKTLLYWLGEFVKKYFMKVRSSLKNLRKRAEAAGGILVRRGKKIVLVCKKVKKFKAKQG